MGSAETGNPVELYWNPLDNCFSDARAGCREIQSNGSLKGMFNTECPSGYKHAAPKGARLFTAKRLFTLNSTQTPGLRVEHAEWRRKIGVKRRGERSV